MDSIKMLHNMCHYTLNKTDTKAICKVRGFTKREAGTTALFENFFLSDIGLNQAFAQLSQPEIICLHLLNQYGNAVDISFFGELYGTLQSNWSVTFTQRYQDTLKAVKKNLVRRGVLIIAEEPVSTRNDKTKMERWLFRFPKEFAPFLPPLLDEPYHSDQSGEQSDEALRRVIVNIVDPIKQTAVSPLISDRHYQVHIFNGTLKNGQDEFQAAYLKEWQQLSWQSKIRVTAGLLNHKYLNMVDVFVYVFNQLGVNEWLSIGQLLKILEMSFGKIKPEDLKRICEAGYELGVLKRLLTDQPYYRLINSEDSEQTLPKPSEYLSALETDEVVINLQTIPYEALEQIARISILKVRDNQLLATPSLIKFGRAPITVQEHPTVQWLNKNLPAYAQIVTKLKKEWGKHIIHENLLIAQVNDLSLKVQLERKFGKLDDFLFLPNDFIAFPQDYRSQVERIVTKSGQVVNEVNAE